MTEKTVTLEEAAREAALSPEEVKRAEEVGLLPKEKREFTEEDVQALGGVKCLLRVGLSLDDIRELNLSPVLLTEINQYLGAAATAPPETCLMILGSARAVIRAHLDSVNLQIEQLDIQKRSLERRLDALDRVTHKLHTTLQLRPQSKQP